MKKPNRPCRRCVDPAPHVHLDVQPGDVDAIPVPIEDRAAETTPYPTKNVPEFVREAPTRELNVIVDPKLAMGES